MATRKALLRSMPFGQYKGCKFTDIPRSYLQWMVSKFDDREIMRAAKDALETLSDRDHDRNADAFIRHATATKAPQKSAASHAKTAAKARQQTFIPVVNSSPYHREHVPYVMPNGRSTMIPADVVIFDNEECPFIAD